MQRLLCLTSVLAVMMWLVVPAFSFAAAVPDAKTPPETAQETNATGKADQKKPKGDDPDEDDDDWGDVVDTGTPDTPAADVKEEGATTDSPWRFAGFIASELRIFPNKPAFANQRNSTFSPALILEPEILFKWNDDKNRFTFKPYLMVDKDDRNRTHFDIREASFLHKGKGWDATIGISKVFWGVAESRHLVDIINQTDGVVDIDNEDKLGQPMVNLNFERAWGTTSLFVLPGFRKRTFAGDKNRFRGPLPIKYNKPSYEAKAGKWHVDLAARWSKTFGDWDIGISHFYGTSREARLLPGLGGGGQPVLLPRYDLIHQTGLDLQYTSGAWLWKLEAMTRAGHGKRFAAGVGGFEYTSYQIFESSADLGLLMEFQYDGRSKTKAPRVLGDNDLFAGARLALNDEQNTSLLAGPTIDVKNGAVFAFIEAERRIGQSWKLEFEGRLSLSTPKRDPARSIRKDDVLILRLSRFF